MFSGFINELLYATFINFGYMKLRYIVFALVLGFALSSCEKNKVSKIPNITLENFGPLLIQNRDTLFLQFSLKDGDADIGTNRNEGEIFIKDARFPDFAPDYFPLIEMEIEDPDKGIFGSCIYMFTPDKLNPRTPSVPDTTYFLLYIKDRAGHHSDTIMTPQVVIMK
jgi:hypothetical protein